MTLYHRTKVLLVVIGLDAIPALLIGYSGHPNMGLFYYLCMLVPQTLLYLAYYLEWPNHKIWYFQALILSALALGMGPSLTVHDAHSPLATFGFMLSAAAFYIACNTYLLLSSRFQPFCDWLDG